MSALLPTAQQWFNNSGDPLSGGLIYTYVSGTSIPANTYSDVALTVANTNPVVLDSSGRAVLFGNGVYRFVLKTSAGVTISTTDGVSAADRSNFPTFTAGTSGGTTTISDRGGLVVNTTTSTLATHTVVLPSGSGAVSGDRVVFATDGAITSLTVSAGAATVRNGPTTLAVGTSFEFVYNNSTSTWYRVR